MAQQQHAADVHPDELCPPNKRYDLMDANKKVVLEHVQCPPESKILTNIIKNHPLRFSITASSSVPWIYMAQFWQTLKEDISKYWLKFMLEKKELTLTLDDFRQIFHLPQATTNNHNAFVPPPSFTDMVPFYKQVLGFTMELKTQSNFKTIGLLQPWQTLCKILSKCLTTRVTGWDQPPLQIMQIFTKIIVNHYMTIFPDISRRARDMYHNLQDDDIMRNIFNLGRHKNKVRMKIPDWMITDEMKQTEHYRMYTEVFGIDVPLTRSQQTEFTHRTHRTTSASRSPNPDKEVAESSALSRSTVIHLRLPERRSTRLTPPAPVPTVDKEDEMILQDTLQVSLAEHKSREEQEARENVALVDEHLASEEIEKMSDKESPEVEIAKEKEVEITQETEVEITQETPAVDITNVIIPMNVTDEDEEITDEHAILPLSIPSQVDASVKLYVLDNSSCFIHPAQSQTSSVPKQQYQLYLAMKADPQLQQQDIAIWLALQMKFERNMVPQTACRTPAVRPRDQERILMILNPERENSKRQKTSDQDDDFDFWTDSYASDDDEISTKQVSQDIIEEVSANPLMKLSLEDVFIRSTVIWERVHDFQLGIESYQHRMTKVIKGEFEKIKDVKVEDVSLTCDTPLEAFNNEVNRLSRMDDDLFTYEVEVANIPCDSKIDDDSEHEADDDMGYDPSDVAFTEWLGSKIFNYKTMDHYTMKALWIYWIRGDDEVELTDEESSDDMDEVAEDIEGFKTYEDYKDDWIYEWNKDVPWVDEKPWTNARVWTKPTPVKHTYEPFNYKTRCSEWPTCSWMDDGYYNGGNLPGTYIIRNQLHYQDYKWYEALEDSELKDEALRNKGIMKGFIDDDESHILNKIRRWNIYTNYDDAYEINHEDNDRKGII
ncbi:hypothetical protein Tco_0805310 [Tanacetum coccineum]